VYAIFRRKHGLSTLVLQMGHSEFSGKCSNVLISPSPLSNPVHQRDKEKDRYQGRYPAKGDGHGASSKGHHEGMLTRLIIVEPSSRKHSWFFHRLFQWQ
jgi:hypothetical protein